MKFDLFNLFILLSLLPLLVLAKPIKIFLLAGQSNMVGMGSVQHLLLLMNDTNTTEYRDALWDATTGSFRERTDVYIKYSDRHGPLTVGHDSGFAGGRDLFGPELMFGWTLADSLREADKPILLIKTAWGGRNLAIDFRPPASGEGNFSGVKPSHYGWEYRQMISDTIDALANIATYVPGYDVHDGYELSGFVWFQGWNDMLEWDFVREYGTNLVNFIRDVRLDLDAPHLPFIIGELGMHGMNPQGQGSDRVMAMRAIQQTVTLLPEFRNTSLFVRTAPFVVPNGTTYGGGYHYGGRADTYFHIGQAFGQGMLHFLTQNAILGTANIATRWNTWFSFQHVIS